MPMAHRSPARRLAEPGGTILMICLMLMLITAILAGIILFLSRTEATISSNSRASIQASNAAEYGVDFVTSNLAAMAPMPAQCLSPPSAPLGPLCRVQASASVPGGQGPAPCPEGNTMGGAVGCSGYRFTGTGSARGWLSTQASTQIEVMVSIPTGCEVPGSDFC